MKNNTKLNVVKLAKQAVKNIAQCVRSGNYRPEYEGERPTPDRIRLSVHRAFRLDKAYANVFKTKEQCDLFDGYVYQRLRRDGVLKLMRPGR